MSYFSANSGEPFFTVRAFKVNSWPIGNKAVVVFVRVLIKISWTSYAFIVRHILKNQASANYKLLRIRLFTRHPVEVQANAFCGFTNRTLLHESKLTRTTDKERGDVSNIGNLFGLLPNSKNLCLSVSPGVWIGYEWLKGGGVWIGVWITVTNRPKPSENWSCECQWVLS